MHSMNNARMQAYRHWGMTFADEETLIEVGLALCCGLSDKRVGFHRREALLETKGESQFEQAAGLRRWLMTARQRR
jgi:hypothetical protein